MPILSRLGRSGDFAEPEIPDPDSAPVRFDGVEVVEDGTVMLPVTTGGADPGEILAVTGANGSGKTTLLRVLAGIIGPTTGTVRVFGRVPDDRDRRFRASLAALIGPPQTARDLTVVEHLQFIAATWGSSADAARECADALLDAFAIVPLARRYRHELSSGQFRLVALALTFARPGRVLLLDEPEQRLDADRLGLVIDVIRARAQAGATIVLASHSPRLVEELADDRLHLEAGT